MTQTDWVIAGVGLVVSMLLWDISEKLQRLITLVYRIRINNRDRDF